ncbi:MAG: MASE1 domain-containing protein [Pseudomonadota bacterium]
MALGISGSLFGRSLSTLAVFVLATLIEAAAAAWALCYVPRSSAGLLSSTRQTATFLLVVALAVAVVGLGVAPGLRLTGHVDAPLIAVWQTWFAAHAGGLVTIAPAMLLVRAPMFARRLRREHIAVLGYLAVAGPLALFHEVLDIAPSVALALVFVGPLIWWITLADPAPRSALVTLLITLTVMADAIWADGFFVAGSRNAPISLLLLGGALVLFGGALAEGRGDWATVLRSGNRPAAVPPITNLLLFYSACVLTAGFGQSLSPIRETVVSWWPPNGLLVAMLLLSGRREWAWWISAAALAEFSGNLIWFGIPLPLAAAVFVVNALEALLAALLLRRFFPRPVRIVDLRQVGMLILIGGGVAPALGATLGASLNAATGRLDLIPGWFAWWLGDASGVLIAAPAALVVAELWRDHTRISLSRMGEGFIISGLLALTAIAVYFSDLTPYLLLPPVLCAAARFEFKGAIASVTFVAILASLLGNFGAEPISGVPGDVRQQAIANQLFLLIIALSALVTAALARRQQLVLETLARSNHELERRVAIRTAALAQTEAQSRERADELEAIYSATPVGLAVLDTELRYVRVNEKLAEINGKPIADHIGRTVREVVPEIDERSVAALERVLNGDEVWGAEFSGMTPAQPGVVRTWMVNWLPLRDADRNVIGVTLSAEDVTERRVTDRRRAYLLRLAEKTRGLSDPDTIMDQATRLLGEELGVARVGFGEMDEGGDRFTVNPNSGDGGTPDLSGTWWLDDFGPDIARSLKAGETVAIGDVYRDERTVRPDVLSLYTSVRTRSVLSVGLLESGYLRAILFANDTSPHNWTPEEIALFEATRDVLWAEVQRCRAETHLRESEARYRALSDRLEAMVRERTFELQAANRKLRSEISHRETAQAALVQSQKLEAIGQLTSGIAHDFNNVIAAISGGFKLIEKRTNDPRIIQIADHGARAAERGAKIVKQLLAFARQQALAPRRVSVAALIDETGSLLRHSLGPGVQLRVDLPGDLLPIWVDPTQLETSLINLAVNARDAMAGTGELYISARPCPRGEPRRPHELGERDAVAIVVRDTGCGMSPEVLERVLEPFFTTKEAGKGTGLGMAMVHGFTQQSGGCLRIDSRPGEGTEITLYLPAARDDDMSEPVAEPRRPVSRTTGGRILLVDDDDAVRAVTSAQLIDLGYRVTDAPGGDEALRVLARETQFDAIVCDVVMPEMNGLTFAARVREMLPDMPVMFMTGHADRNLLRGETVIDKPFSADDLSRVLANLLDTWRGPGESAIATSEQHARDA